MIEGQQNNQQPNNNQQGNMVPPNWNIPTMNMNPMMAMWMTNPWLAYSMGMNQGRQNNNNPWFGNPMMSNGTQGNGQSQEIQNNQPVQNVNQDQTPENKRLVIPCGIVESQEDIRPADVPMDDGFGMFMRKDLEEIYLKQWGNDGKINTRKYVPVPEPVPDRSSELTAKDVLDQTNARFERIEMAFDTLIQDLNSSKKGSSNQKSIKKSEVNIDE